MGGTLDCVPVLCFSTFGKTEKGFPTVEQNMAKIDFLKSRYRV
jgi:hypothetical protein